MKPDDFFRELWAFVATLPPSLPKKLVFDIYEIGWRINKGQPGDWWDSLSWCAKDLAKHTKSKLPDHLHSRRVLSQNRHAADYVKKWGA